MYSGSLHTCTHVKYPSLISQHTPGDVLSCIAGGSTPSLPSSPTWGGSSFAVGVWFTFCSETTCACPLSAGPISLEGAVCVCVCVCVDSFQSTHTPGLMPNLAAIQLYTLSALSKQLCTHHALIESSATGDKHMCTSVNQCQFIIIFKHK